MRRCKKCGQEKSESEFYQYIGRPGKKPKRRFSCIECEREACKTRYKEKPYKDWPQSWKDKAAKWRKLYYDESRAAVLDHYGRKCACCGETEEMFLTIDHIENNGNIHRKTVHAANLPKWLVKHGFPAGFQILCRNCNWAKHANNGVCPHQSQKVQRLSENGVASSDAKREAPENWGGDIVCSYM